MVQEGSAGKQGIAPDPARSYKPAEVYRRGQEGSAMAGKSCEHPGCTTTFAPKRKDSRYCEAHSTGAAWRERNCKSSDSPQKSASPAKAAIGPNSPRGAAAPVQPSGRKRPAKEAARDGTERQATRRRAARRQGAGGRVAQPPAPPPASVTLRDAYRAAHADLVAKRDALNATIAGLELVMGEGA